MALKSFVFVLLFLATISYFIPVDSVNKVKNEDDSALLIFDNATMYTLNPQSINRIVNAKKALRYKNRDEIFDGVLVLRSKDSKNRKITDTLTSDLIIKKGDNFEFINNVVIRRDDYISLKTDQLMYDSKTKIAMNYLPFKGRYFNNTIKGEKVYLDMNKSYMKAKNTHFEIDMEKGK